MWFTLLFTLLCTSWRTAALGLEDPRRDGFQNAVADKELELERRRLRGKSKVKIPVAM